MDETNLSVFSRLYQHPGSRIIRGYPPTPYRVSGLAEIVRKAIDAQSEELGGRGVVVRPDAQYFLLLNLLNMVARPILMSGQTDMAEVERAIFGDVFLLLDSASKQPPAEIRRTEISSHAIVEALARNWRALRISQFRFWGGDEEEG
jgi:hypothetical protein